MQRQCTSLASATMLEGRSKYLEVVMKRPCTRPYSQARGMTSSTTTGVVKSTTSMAKPVLMLQYSMPPTLCSAACVGVHDPQTPGLLRQSQHSCTWGGVPRLCSVWLSAWRCMIRQHQEDQDCRLDAAVQHASHALRHSLAEGC